MIKKRSLKKKLTQVKKRYHKNSTKRSIHKKKKNIKKMFGGTHRVARGYGKRSSQLSARVLALMKIGAKIGPTREPTNTTSSASQHHSHIQNK